MVYNIIDLIIATAITVFKHLQDQKYTQRHNENHIIVVRRYPEDHEYCDHVSNHFTETIRINCRLANYDTPWEVWNRIKNENNVVSMNKHDQRECVYSLTKEGNTFNLTYCLYIILTSLKITQRY